MSEQNIPPLTRVKELRRLAERRAFVRYPSSQSSSCQSVRSGDRDCWPAMFSDISIGGLSLAVCRPFAQGEVLALELPQPVEGLRGRLFVQVMHATEKPGGVWTVGCRFVDKLTDYELEALL